MVWVGLALGIRVERICFQALGVPVGGSASLGAWVPSMPWEHLGAASLTFVFPLCFVVVGWLILYPHPPEWKSATRGPVWGPSDNKLFRGEFLMILETLPTGQRCVV